MTAPATRPPRRRGACPALSAPMETGDGLLVRLVPDSGALALPAFAGLARAAQAHGNGILEITARGSLQVRGLSHGTLPAFTDAVVALGIVAREGLAIGLSPLSGLDVREEGDGRPLARAILEGVARAGLQPRLGPKVSVVIDGGGSIPLAALKADIRLLAQADGRWALALGGVGGTAAPDGAWEEGAAVARVLHHLARIADRGRDARMADLLPPAPTESDSLLLLDGPRPGVAMALRDDTLALPLALPFGAVESAAMIALADDAAAHGVRDLRPAPGRLLLATGVMAEQVEAFRAAAGELGFIVDASDPRLSIAACPGRPLCASGLIAARALAGDVARALAPMLDGTTHIHLSACTKGCAHPGPAALTLVGVAHAGMDSAVSLVRNGKASSAPQAVFPATRLFAVLNEASAHVRPGETGALAFERLAAVLSGPSD